MTLLASFFVPPRFAPLLLRRPFTAFLLQCFYFYVLVCRRYSTGLVVGRRRVCIRARLEAFALDLGGAAAADFDLGQHIGGFAFRFGEVVGVFGFRVGGRGRRSGGAIGGQGGREVGARRGPCPL